MSKKKCKDQDPRIAEVITHLSPKWLLWLIQHSSYYTKEIEPINVTRSTSVKTLAAIYLRCRDYACTSIVDSLMPFDELQPSQTYYINCDECKPFHILARVRTSMEQKTIEETAEQRRFLSFSVLTEKNLSHFPGRVLYGYHTGINPSMIGYICGHDGDTEEFANTRWELAELPEALLDIDDLCNEALELATYCQVSIESKYETTSGTIEPLRPDVVLAINRISGDDRLAAIKRRLPILVLRQGLNTIVRVKNYFPTEEFSSPLHL